MEIMKRGFPPAIDLDFPLLMETQCGSKPNTQCWHKCPWAQQDVECDGGRVNQGMRAPRISRQWNHPHPHPHNRYHQRQPCIALPASPMSGAGQGAAQAPTAMAGPALPLHSVMEPRGFRLPYTGQHIREQSAGCGPRMPATVERRTVGFDRFV